MTAPRKSARTAAAIDVPPGVVKVAKLDPEWFAVAIGRPARTKRFNITRGEAAELVRVLCRDVLTLELDRAAS